MAEEKPKTEVKTEAKAEVKKEVSKDSSVKEAPKSPGGTGSKKKFITKKFDKNKRGPRRRKGPRKPRSEYDQKIVSIRRVTRVVAGGRRFSFSVAMVIGDRKGTVGVGIGKASDTALAIEKAVKDAKKHLIRPNLTKENSIPFEIEAKYCASRVLIIPTPGKGVKAGGAVRVMLDLLGANDISAKILSRSKNHLNNARATVKALSQIGLKSPIKVVKSPESSSVSLNGPKTQESQKKLVSAK